jgi:peptidoglycan-associated lipoprotein
MEHKLLRNEREKSRERTDEMMKLMLVASLMALLLLGCGVNKEYVSQQIADSESRTNAKIDGVSDKSDTNATEIASLKSLAAQLEEKADLAINKAEGFENYQMLWSGEVNFAFDSYEIDDVAAGILNEAGEKLEAAGGSVIEIVGHTDRTGASKYNYLLGEKRASSAKRYLAERFGISLYRMFILSYGEDKPVAMPDEQQASSKNRRVTLAIWGPQ